MKRNRHGTAKILTQPELQLLFSDGLTKLRDRTLFAIMLYSACRIREGCTLLTDDIYNRNGVVRSHLTIRKKNTKRKLATRTIPIIEELRTILTHYYPEAGVIYLFPGRGSAHMHPDSASKIFQRACEKVGIDGASTHSFRRTALTQMSDNNIPLRVIAEVSGHRNLGQLNAYLEVRDEQVLGAVSSLSMLSPVQASSPQTRKLEFDGDTSDKTEQTPTEEEKPPF